MSRLHWQLAASPTSIDESGTDFLYGVDLGQIVLSLPCFVFRFLKLPQVDVGHHGKPRGMAVAPTAGRTKHRR
jgi:hypothetical protein